MYLRVLAILMTLAIFWPMIESRLFTVDRYIQYIEPYSGLSPSDFELFKKNMHLFREKLYKDPQWAKIHLEAALDSARNLTLCTRTADSSIQYEIDEKIDEIRETMIKRIPQ